VCDSNAAREIIAREELKVNCFFQALPPSAEEPASNGLKLKIIIPDLADY